MSPSRYHALFTEASMLSHKPQSISSQFENRFHSSDPTQRSPQSKQGVKNLRSSKLLPFWSPFILHLLRKPIRRRNVSRMHSLAQSCCWGISVSFFTSLQELHNQASWEKGKWVEKCLCSTCREELPDVTCQHQRHSVTRWGCVAGGGAWLTDRLSAWMRISLRERRRKIIISSMATCVCISRCCWGRLCLHGRSCTQVCVHVSVTTYVL